MKKVIVYGTTVLSEMLFHETAGDPDFEIAAFCADAEYIAEGSFMGLPLFDFSDAKRVCPPQEFDMVAIYTSFRDQRARVPFYLRAKDAGYRLRNFVSPKADVAPDLVMGENNLIFAQAHIGVRGRMGSNNIIRQQVYLGHGFVLGDHNVISPGCNIAADCVMESGCYIGIGATIIEHLHISDETLVGAGGLVLRDTEPYSKNIGNPSKVIGYHQDTGIMLGGRR